MIPSVEQCFELMKKYGMLDNIRAHSIVVEKVAAIIAGGQCPPTRLANDGFDLVQTDAQPVQFDEPAGPSDDPEMAAFRAHREAMENAQFALKKLAAQAHGEALMQLLSAWEKRDAALLPTAQDLGGRAAGQARNAWVKAVSASAAVKSETASQHLLRLEMAAEVPTPAEHLDARRGMQLQLLTRRNDPAPAQTWAEDTAQVLAAAYDATQARRLQNVLKVLLKR